MRNIIFIVSPYCIILNQTIIIAGITKIFRGINAFKSVMYILFLITTQETTISNEVHNHQIYMKSSYIKNRSFQEIVNLYKLNDSDSIDMNILKS